MRAEMMTAEGGEPANGGRGLRVCAYYRMSDDEQQLSIDQQKAEVRRLCAQRGWVLVAEYLDSGKSGSKNVAKRKDFHRLIADAKHSEWSAIVVYNSSRFGRLDSIDSAQYKNELRKHGICLETVTEGRIDWRTSMGRIQDAIFTEQNHKYSTDLAESCVRGRHDIVERGYWGVGEIPFGYDREFVEDGKTVMVIPRTKSFRKPRNWHTVLKVNEAEAAIVKDIFKRFGSSDISARSLVKQLNFEHTPSSGSAWTAQMLIKTLRDYAYIGTARVGFSRKTKEAHKRMSQTVNENACASIVSRPLFEKVQAKLDERGKGFGASNSAQVRSGALSGILICGHCGFRMDKRERVKADGTRHVHYVCSSANRRQHLGCRQWVAREADLLPILVDELLTAIDYELVKRIEAKPHESKAGVVGQRNAVSRLEKRYEKARANLLLADAELFAALQKDALSIKAELDKSRNTLTVLESDNAKTAAVRFKDWWDKTRPSLVKLTVNHKVDKTKVGVWQRQQSVFMSQREAVRDLLKSLNATLTLYWTPKGERYHTLTTGVLRAEINGHTVQDEHVLNADSNKCNRARSRDRD